MARSKARVRQVVASGRPLRDANFLPKRERKRVRKNMVRAYLSNKVADAMTSRQARIEFYRNLRYLKVRRLKIAQEMNVLADMVDRLRSDIDRVWVRNERNHPSIYPHVVEAQETAKRAAAAVNTGADEWQMFAKRKVYYSEAVPS